MFFEIAANNLFVLLIYCLAGVLILMLTGSKLAPIGPWAVFSVHMIQATIIFISHVSCLGLLPCLAMVLPHGCLEFTGLALGCSAGSKLCFGRRPVFQLAAAAVLILMASYVEIYVTPAPLSHWL